MSGKQCHNTVCHSRAVARVCVDTPLAHLDRPFDYLVPAELDEAAVPGVRVRVRFAGRLVNGWLLARVERSEALPSIVRKQHPIDR